MMLWGVNQAWAGILSASLACCVTSGKVLTLSGPSRPAFKWMHVHGSCSFVRVKRVNVGEGLGTATVPVKLELLPWLSRGNILEPL